MRDIHIHAGHTCGIYIAQCKIYSERCIPRMYDTHVCPALRDICATMRDICAAYISHLVIYAGHTSRIW